MRLPPFKPETYSGLLLLAAPWLYRLYVGVTAATKMPAPSLYEWSVMALGATLVLSLAGNLKIGYLR